MLVWVLWIKEKTKEIELKIQKFKIWKEKKSKMIKKKMQKIDSKKKNEDKLKWNLLYHKEVQHFISVFALLQIKAIIWNDG